VDQSQAISARPAAATRKVVAASSDPARRAARAVVGPPETATGPSMPMILDGGRRRAQGASHPATVVLSAVRGRGCRVGQLALTEKSLNEKVAGTPFVETSSTP